MENERGSKEWFRVSAKEYREFADECMGWAKTAAAIRSGKFSRRWRKLGFGRRHNSTAILVFHFPDMRSLSN